MKKIVETLREMQYKRLRTTRSLRDMQKTALLPGLEIIQNFIERDANTILNMAIASMEANEGENDK